MPKSVRPALVGVWGQAGIAFALVVLRGFSTVEARNRFDR